MNEGHLSENIISRYIITFSVCNSLCLAFKTVKVIDAFDHLLVICYSSAIANIFQHVI